MNQGQGRSDLAGVFEANVCCQMAHWLVRDPAAYVGDDWWQMTRAEADVFAVDRKRFPVLACAMFAYEAFKDIAQVDDFGPDAVLDEARRRFPQWAGLRVIDAEEFSAFAKRFCGLTAREAHAIYWMQEFWKVRAGILRFVDEQPA